MSDNLYKEKIGLAEGCLRVGFVFTLLAAVVLAIAMVVLIFQ
jgi:hypothetical protein